MSEYVDLVILVDSRDDMMSFRQAVIDGFNAVISTEMKYPAKVTTVLFGTECHLRDDRVDIKDAKPLNDYYPDGDYSFNSAIKWVANHFLNIIEAVNNHNREVEAIKKGETWLLPKGIILYIIAGNEEELDPDTEELIKKLREICGWKVFYHGHYANNSEYLDTKGIKEALNKDWDK